jgi:iron complex transport system substrate-binding protein
VVFTPARLTLVFCAAVALAAGSPAARAIAPPPDRIVSLSPSTTEILFALGAGPEVVGVSQFCDYPDAAARLPRVGSFLTPNVEAIAGLRPTLVVGLEISSNLREVRAVEAMGYPTLMVGDGTLADIRAAILTIGGRIGRAQQARDLVGALQANIDAVRDRLKDAPPRKVLMLVGHQPLVAVGPGTYLDELLKLAGGINIADQAVQAWPRLSIEYVIAEAPDVILDGQMGTDAGAPGGFWAQYRSIPAVANHRVYGYPQDLMLRPGPRVSESLAMLAAMIHPEAATGSAAVANQVRRN